MRGKGKIHFSVIGCGKIGSAALRYIDERSGYISVGMGHELIPEYVCDIDSGKLEFLKDLENIHPKITGSAEEVINDPKTQIIIEATATDGPARDYILESFRNSKSVVTPNELVIAKYMRELFDEARRCRQEFGFESSVMAGAPLINDLRDNTDRIERYLAILNGTSNLILTQIPEMGYDGALEYARFIGAAEQDASSDTSGRDTANKNKILAALSYGADVDYRTMVSPDFMEGIENITDMDIRFAEEFGYRIKLLGKSRMHGDGRLEIGTFPYLLDSGHMLANVDGTNNAIHVDFVDKGPQMHYGKGAEPRPTGVAVVEDIIQTARKMRGGEVDTPLIWNDIEPLGPSELKCPFYLRFIAVDRPGVFSKISGILADNNVSIAAAIQKEKNKNEPVPIVMLTHESRAGDVLNATDSIDRTLKGNTTRGDTVAIRVENG